MIGRAVASAICVLAVSLGAMQCWPPQRPSKPILYITHASWCAPCQAYEREINYPTNKPTALAIGRRYIVRLIDADSKDPRTVDFLRRAGVSRAPTWFTFDHRGPRILQEGWDVKNPNRMQDLLVSLGVGRPAPVADRAERGKRRAGENTEPNRNGRREPALQNRSTDAERRLRQQIEDLRDRITRTESNASDQQKRSRAEREKLAEEYQSQLEELQLQLEEARETAADERKRYADELFPPSDSASSDPVAGPAAADTDGPSWLRTLARLGLAVAAPEIAIPTTAAGVAVTALGFGFRWWRRRRHRRREASTRGKRGDFPSVASPAAEEQTPVEVPLPRAREFDEAGQLLRLRELEGRHPLHDSLFGQLAEAEIENDVESDDPAIVQAAIGLRDRINRRFNQIAPLSTNSEDHQ